MAGAANQVRETLKLIVITDASVAAGKALVCRAEELAAHAAPGTLMFQLRDRELPVGERRALGEALVEIGRRFGQFCVVNDRLDLALLLGADGVHLGEGSLSPGDARAFYAQASNPGSRRPWISRAWHESERAPEPGADAYLISPVMQERKGRSPMGAAGLEEARRSLMGSESRAASLVALGGVDAGNAEACLAHGADAVAVIGAAWRAPSVEPLLGALGISR